MLIERKQKMERARRPVAGTRHHIFSAWRDINRGGSTLTPDEGQMKRYS